MTDREEYGDHSGARGPEAPGRPGHSGQDGQDVPGQAELDVPEQHDGQDEQDVLDLLRVADPAATVEPSPGFVAAVLARANDDAESTLGAAAPDASAPIDLVAARSATPETAAPDTHATPTTADTPAPVPLRRRPRWQTWLAGAAAAVVVGATGFGAGSLAATGGLAMGGSDSGGAESAEAADSAAAGSSELAREESQYPGMIELGQPGAGQPGAGQPGPVGQPGQGGAAADGAAGSGMAAERQASADYWGGPGFWGNREFVGSGFGTSPGAATLYGLDPQVATEASAARLAATFGVEGEPRLEWGSWNVGPEDGTSATLNLSLDGSASFYFQNWTLDPMQRCWTDPPTTDYDPDAPEWRDYESTQQACMEDVAAAAPAPEAARAALEGLLGDLGFDPATYEITERGHDGSGSARASAVRVVDGQRTNLMFELALAPDGITSVWGSLADVTSLRDVSIVSEAEAFERLSDPRFGAQGGSPFFPMPVDLAARDVPEYAPPTQAPPAPGGDVTIEWPVWRVELTSVRLGLAQHYQSDGAVLLIPAYEFTASDGGTWSVIAVADSALAFDQP